MKRAIIVHGWGGTPQEGWFPWLKKDLEKKGFSISVPQLPDTEHPHIKTWVPALAVAVGTPDQETYLVGHSMGCQTIIRYLETLKEGKKIGGAVFVAGFIRPLTGLTTAEEKEIDREWTLTPINFDGVRSRLGRSKVISTRSLVSKNYRLSSRNSWNWRIDVIEDMDTRKRVLEILEKGHLMSLATVDEGGVWVADVIYVYDDALTLYWMSSPEVRHSYALLQNPQVAGTITVSNGAGEPNLGIQFSGRAEKIEGARHDLATKHLRKRGRPEPKETDDVLDGDSWYKLTPSKLELVDEEHLGFEKRTLELPLNE